MTEPADRRLYYLERARHPDQRAYMEQLEADGTCLFCPDYLLNDPAQRIVFETSHWIALYNRFPYTGTRLHLLLSPRAHVSDLLELGPEAHADYWDALRRLTALFGLDSYSTGVRNGDPSQTGGTIAHVHVHVIVSDGGLEPPRMKFG